MQLAQFILPVIYGCKAPAFFIHPRQRLIQAFTAVEIAQTHIGRIPFNFALISRRSRYRAGTRYFTRGIDKEGHVANFNETEQLLLIDPDTAVDGKGQSYGLGGVANVEGRTKMSYVQTRGSIPLYWAEINTLRYKPDLLLMEKEDAVSLINRACHHTRLTDDVEFLFSAGSSKPT